MLTPEEMERRLEEARILRAKVLDARAAGREMGAPLPPEAPAAQGLPEPDVSPDPDKAGPSAAEERAQVMDLLASPEMQRRLEEARVQRAAVLAARDAARAAEPSVALPRMDRPSDRDAPLAGLDTTASLPVVAERALPPVPHDLQAIRSAIAPARRPAPESEQRRERRRPWPLSLAIGLVAGLALGIGLMRLVEAVPPWLAEALGTPSQANPPAIEASAEPALADPSRDRPARVPLEADAGPASRAAGAMDTPDEAESAPAMATASAPAGAGDREPPLLRPTAQREARPAPVTLLLDPPLPASLPLPLLATPAARDEPPVAQGPAIPVVAAVAPAERPRVTLHLVPGLSEAALAEAQSALQEAGFDLAVTEVARFGTDRSRVLFFHPGDALAADRAAELLGAEPRDFSAYQPAPPPGTLEIWLSGGG